MTSVLTLNAVNIFNHVTIQECIMTCCSVRFLLHYFPHCYHFNSSSTYLFNPLNTKLNPICHLLALLATHPIFHVSRIRVNGTRSNNCDTILSNWMITNWEG